MSVFPNKNPKLFGQAEDSEAIIDTPAVAGLTGSIVLAEDLDQGNTDLAATTSTSTNESPRFKAGSDGTNRITFSNITTPTDGDSVLIIILASATFLGNSDSNKAWEFKRDATVLDSFLHDAGESGQTRASLRVFTQVNPPAGTFDYTVTDADGNSFGGIIATLFFIKATDTHAAEITTPATAIKQINSPDTHRTQQTEVIP